MPGGGPNNQYAASGPYSCNRVAFDRLLKPIQAGDIVHRADSVGGDPELLAVLDLARRNVLKRLDAQRRVVAIVRGIPFPIAPSADGRQSHRSEVPVGDTRNAALAGIDRQIRVDIRFAIVRIHAGRRVVLAGRQCGILLCQRLQCGSDAHEDLRAAIRRRRGRSPPSSGNGNPRSAERGAKRGLQRS